ncbi:MAG TPA: hypothetical protein VIF60_08610 [Burkholderiaceae bacterium]
MSYQLDGSANVYDPMPRISGMSAEDMEIHRQEDAARREGMEQQLWAEAQNIALSKIKMFHTLAKAVYDQN